MDRYNCFKSLRANPENLNVRTHVRRRIHRTCMPRQERVGPKSAGARREKIARSAERCMIIALFCFVLFVPIFHGRSAEGKIARRVSGALMTPGRDPLYERPKIKNILRT